MVYGSNQWISFDDAESFQQKKKYLFSRCLRGLMIWSLDLDTQDFGAMTELFGEDAMADAIIDGSGLDPDDRDELAAYTGEDCYVTPRCTDGTSDEQGPDQVCKGGFSALETAHNPTQHNANYDMHGKCAKGWWRTICCPTKAMPRNCEWVGAPEISTGFGCHRGCGDTQFELTTDTFIDAKGKANCFVGARSVCSISSVTLVGQPSLTMGPSSAATPLISLPNAAGMTSATGRREGVVERARFI